MKVGNIARHECAEIADDGDDREGEDHRYAVAAGDAVLPSSRRPQYVLVIGVMQSLDFPRSSSRFHDGPGTQVHIQIG